MRLGLDKLSAREQRLLLVFGAILGAFLLLGAPYYLYSAIASGRERNADIRRVLTRMDKAALLLAQRRAEKEARDQLYQKAPVPLASFIEGAARAEEIDVPESSDQPDIFVKGYVEHATQVKFRKVGLKALVGALEQIERSGMAMAVTSLHISSRSKPDEYDVTLTVSQYEKKGDGEGKKPGRGGAEPKKGQSL